jgi:hypothetical protein
MIPRTIRLVPGGIAFGIVPRMRLLWLPVDDSDPEATADSVFQIRVRVCGVAYETHRRSNDMSGANCTAEAVP